MMVTQFLVPTQYWDNTDTQCHATYEYEDVSCRGGNADNPAKGNFALLKHVSISRCFERWFQPGSAATCCVCISLLCCFQQPEHLIHFWLSIRGRINKTGATSCRVPGLGLRQVSFYVGGVASPFCLQCDFMIDKAR